MCVCVSVSVCECVLATFFRRSSLCGGCGCFVKLRAHHVLVVWNALVCVSVLVLVLALALFALFLLLLPLLIGLLKAGCCVTCTAQRQLPRSVVVVLAAAVCLCVHKFPAKQKDNCIVQEVFVVNLVSSKCVLPALVTHVTAFELRKERRMAAKRARS